MNDHKKAMQRCADAMAQATDYAAWCEAAREHDRLSGAADWKEQLESSDYDYSAPIQIVEFLNTIHIFQS